jgi:hypothetical protein
MRIRYRAGTYTNGIPDVAYIEQDDVPAALITSRLHPIDENDLAARVKHLESLLEGVLLAMNSEQLSTICKSLYIAVDDTDV